MKKTLSMLLVFVLTLTLVLSACSSTTTAQSMPQDLAQTLAQPPLQTASAVPLSNTSDQPSTWAVNGVSTARDLRLVTAEMNSGFRSATTRAEFCRLSINLVEVYYGKQIGTILAERGLTPGRFNDTNDPAILAASALGITSGTGGGNFSPNGTLTREQAATMIRNVLNVLGQDTTNARMMAWTDLRDIASWAIDSVDVMYATGIMTGTSSSSLVFSPKTAYTREQAIVTMLRLWEYMQERGGTTLPGTTPPPVPPTQQPTQPRREYNMDDVNVRNYPIFVTARSAAELQEGTARYMRVLVAPNVWEEQPIYGWQSGAQTIHAWQNTDRDNWVDGILPYDMNKPMLDWVNNYLATNNISIAGMTDYQKTGVIGRIIEEDLLEGFIGLWEPGYRFTWNNCAQRAEAVNFMMIAMDFEMFRIVSGNTSNDAHGWNAYWDSTVGAVRFIDAGWPNVWNIFVDELAGQGFILTRII